MALIDPGIPPYLTQLALLLEAANVQHEATLAELRDVREDYAELKQDYLDYVAEHETPDPPPPDPDPVPELPGWVEHTTTDFDSLADWGIEDGTTTQKGALWPAANNQTQGNDNSVNMARNVTTSPERGLVGFGRREPGLSRPFSSFELIGNTDALELPNYFRAEVRGRFRDEYGVWPCLLWFRPGNSSTGEIDVMEWMGGMWSGDQKRVAITMHNEYGATQDSAKKPLILKNAPWYDPNAEHVYTVEKVPGSITVWIDGRKVATFSAADKTWWNRVMEVRDRTWYPRITLQIGQGATTKVVPNPVPSWVETEVEVRSYRDWTMDPAAPV